MSYSSQFLKDADLLDKFGFHDLAEKIERLAFSDKRIITAANEQTQKSGKFNFVANQILKDDQNYFNIKNIYQRVRQSGCNIQEFSNDFFTLLQSLKFIPYVNPEQTDDYKENATERCELIVKAIRKKDPYALLLACTFEKGENSNEKFSDEYNYRIARLNDVHGFHTGRRLDFKDAVYFYECSVNYQGSRNIFSNKILPCMNDILDLYFEKFKTENRYNNDEIIKYLYKLNSVFGPRTYEWLKRFAPEMDLNDSEQKLNLDVIHNAAMILPMDNWRPQTFDLDNPFYGETEEIHDGLNKNYSGMGNFLLANSNNGFDITIDELYTSSNAIIALSKENKQDEVRRALKNFLKPYENVDIGTFSQLASQLTAEFDSKYKNITKRSVDFLFRNLYENRSTMPYFGVLSSWDKKVLYGNDEIQVKDLIGKISFEDLNSIIETDTMIRDIGLENVKDLEFARSFLKNCSTKNKHAFLVLQDLFLNNQDKEPNWAGKIVTSGDLIGRILPKSDKRFLFVGDITSCCQKYGGFAHKSCFDSIENEFSSIFVIENKSGRILAQSYVWEDKNGKIVFDSFETKNKDAQFNEDCYKIIKEISKEFNTDVYIGNWNSFVPQELKEQPQIRSTFLKKYNYDTYESDSTNVKPLNVEIQDTYDLMNAEDFERAAELIHLKYLRLSKFEDQKRFLMLAQETADKYGKFSVDDIKDLKKENIDLISLYISDSYNNVVEYAINSPFVRGFKDDAKKYLQMQQWNLEGLKDLQIRQDDYVGLATYTPTTLYVVYENETVPNKSYMNLPLSAVMTMIANSAGFLGDAGKTKYDISEFNKYGIYFNKATESSIISIHSSMKIPKDYDLENFGHLIEQSRDPNNIKELLTDENGNIKKSSRLDMIFETILLRNLNLDFIMDCGYVFLKNPFEQLSNTAIIGILNASKNSYSYSDLLSRNIVIPKDSNAGLGLIANDPNHSDSLTEVQKVVYADKSFQQKWRELEQLGVEEPWTFIDEHIRIYGGKYQNEDAFFYVNYKNDNLHEWNSNYPMDVNKCEDFIKNWLCDSNKWKFLNLVYEYGFQYRESNYEKIEEIYKEKFPTRDQENMTEETQ